MPGYADPNPMYQPAMRLITAITNDTNAEVTTSFAHNYLSGLIVRIIVPNLRFGMIQMDKRVGTIAVTGDTTFTINIDSTNFDTFVIPDPEEAYTNIFPMVIPIGEINEILYQATRNVL